MKKLFLILPLLISGCAWSGHKPDDLPCVSHELVAKKVPSELLEIPSLPSSPDINGTQKDLALWLIENEKRVKALENQLDKIKTYNNEK